MGPNELSAAISAAEPLIRSMIALGLPGIVLLAAAIPALVIIVAFVMNYKHAKRMENIVETYRHDTQQILDDMGAKHAEVAEFLPKERQSCEGIRTHERQPANPCREQYACG